MFMRIIKEIIPYIVIILTVLLIRMFVFTPVQVDGSSMEPTLSNNQILILNLFDKNYDRFDVVVVEELGTKLVKRIVGLPGEHISYTDNKLYVDGELIVENYHREVMVDFDIKELGLEVIPDNSYFIMGDNRNHSSDSRNFGPVSIEQIQGKTGFTIFPFTKFGFVK